MTTLAALLRQLPLQRMARNTIVSADLLSARLDEITDSGIGLDNEEFIDGMVACAVPVQNAQQRFVASLFVHAPVVRTSLDD
ncbi:IclR family transcriptional regulator C-terminal domain-containing protein, partial [Escherichia coli]|uniref:IclR family transcriptional regulator C-terminal domain-containing protein n=1 Tax=Escherichia coli TaxID=562 RepID=UPI00215B5E13